MLEYITAKTLMSVPTVATELLSRLDKRDKLKELVRSYHLILSQGLCPCPFYSQLENERENKTLEYLIYQYLVLEEWKV